MYSFAFNPLHWMSTVQLRLNSVSTVKGVFRFAFFSFVPNTSTHCHNLRIRRRRQSCRFALCSCLVLSLVACLSSLVLFSCPLSLVLVCCHRPALSFPPLPSPSKLPGAPSPPSPARPRQSPTPWFPPPPPPLLSAPPPFYGVPGTTRFLWMACSRGIIRACSYTGNYYIHYSTLSTEAYRAWYIRARH